MILFSQLKGIVNGELISAGKDQPVISLITDSRKATASEGAAFFAIKGLHHDGHQYIHALYDLGIRLFVVEYTTPAFINLKDANILKVTSSLRAIQQISTYHRSQFSIPVIGITGSNGKTIIKEWLYQLLSPDFKIVKNPGSYNSQLGVPLSVWQIQSHHELGIFEAGISKAGEMEKLAAIIKPTVGLFTNIGSAHDEGFQNQEQKISEKLKLFSNADTIIYCKDHGAIDKSIRKLSKKFLTWGFKSEADIVFRKTNDYYQIDYQGNSASLRLPFHDQASIENAFHCIAVMLHLQYGFDEIQERIKILRSVPMRLELKEGINQCQVIDDTYNNDIAGLQISLDFLANQQQKKKKRLILSDILESGLSDEQLAEKISQIVTQNGIQSFVGIGRILFQYQSYFNSSFTFYESTEAFLKSFDFNALHQEIILVKGARSFQFEKIVNRLQRKVHGTVMEIDLGAVVHNLNFFKARLEPATKVMVMVKAFAYGSGSIEIANVLQFHKVDYLGVAYADEGVELRKNNITLPIMVMNPSEESFDLIRDHNLEPEIYSFKIFESYINYLNNRSGIIHLKLDTGMHRLGFNKEDLPLLIQRLKHNKHITVASIFSHLAGSDEAQHDEFSKSQANAFLSMANTLVQALQYRPIFHLLNSPGTLRLPEFQFDMIRLGIGLYGVNPTTENIIGLKPVATLKTIVSQIRKIHAGETIGYGRRGKAEKDLTIATIAIGYADGFSRAFSRGVGEVMVNGKIARVIGNVCMDMTMIDVTGIDVNEGDDVIIFGADFPIQAVAEKINTIPYEILTNTSERVKRVFIAESI